MLHRPCWPPSVVILGVESDERTLGFSAALEAAGYAPARVLDYRDFVEEPHRLPRMFGTGDGLLRLESPGGTLQAWQALAKLGGEIAAARGENALDAATLAQLVPDKGVILA